MNPEDIVQGSPEWVAVRVGVVTGSRISDLLAGGKGLTRSAYKTQLIAERLTGQSMESTYETSAMREGKAQEPFGRLAYEMAMDVMVDQVGFVPHPKIDKAGCSPDGLVLADGGLELKCPMAHTHVGYLEDVDAEGKPKCPSKYLAQIQWCMACTGRRWWDFASYNPVIRQAPLVVVRVERDDEWIEKTEKAVQKFLDEVQEAVDRLAPEDPFARVPR